VVGRGTGYCPIVRRGGENQEYGGERACVISVGAVRVEQISPFQGANDTTESAKGTAVVKALRGKEVSQSGLGWLGRLEIVEPNMV
jgi:hypothetical protein